MNFKNCPKIHSFRKQLLLFCRCADKQNLFSKIKMSPRRFQLFQLESVHKRRSKLWTNRLYHNTNEVETEDKCRFHELLTDFLRFFMLLRRRTEKYKKNYENMFSNKRNVNVAT